MALCCHEPSSLVGQMKLGLFGVRLPVAIAFNFWFADHANNSFFVHGLVPHKLGQQPRVWTLGCPQQVHLLWVGQICELAFIIHRAMMEHRFASSLAGSTHVLFSESPWCCSWHEVANRRMHKPASILCMLQFAPWRISPSQNHHKISNHPYHLANSKEE